MKAKLPPPTQTQQPDFDTFLKQNVSQEPLLLKKVKKET
jgi:hypothetical protein